MIYTALTSGTNQHAYWFTTGPVQRSGGTPR